MHLVAFLLLPSHHRLLKKLSSTILNFFFVYFNQFIEANEIRIQTPFNYYKRSIVPIITHRERDKETNTQHTQQPNLNPNVDKCHSPFIQVFPSNEQQCRRRGCCCCCRGLCRLCCFKLDRPRTNRHSSIDLNYAGGTPSSSSSSPSSRVLHLSCVTSYITSNLSFLPIAPSFF